MKIIWNSIIPVRGFKAMNLFGILFCRKGAVVDNVTIIHESIHTAQMKELLYIFFYLWYIMEYLIKLFAYGSKAYRNISFEREAYAYEGDEAYLGNRKHYTWMKYIW